MANEIWTGDPRRFNEGRSLKFRVGYRLRQTPEEGWRTYQPKRWGNKNRYEDDNPKTFYDLKKCDTRSILSGVYRVRIQIFPHKPLTIPKLTRPVCYTWMRIVVYIPFFKLWVQWEMQTDLSRIWTRVTVPISYDENHYTTNIF